MNQIVFDLRKPHEKELIQNCNKVHTIKRECNIYEEQPELIYSLYVDSTKWEPSVHDLNEHGQVVVIHTMELTDQTVLNIKKPKDKTRKPYTWENLKQEAMQS